MNNVALHVDRLVCAVIVTFNPIQSLLNRLIVSIHKQVDWVVIVDDASSFPINGSIIEKNVTYILNSENKGLAEAQNKGIKWAIDNAATHVIIFDQDSEPIGDMVEQLISAEARLIELGQQVAAVGPIFTDIKSNETSPFLSLKKYSITKKNLPDFESYAEAFCLISSGQLIRCSVIREVGMMRGDLFIDFIDIEWGLRAGRKGYKCFGVFSAKMNHSFGDSSVQICNKTVSLHSPYRNYYITRNAIILYLSSYIPFAWKVADLRLFFKRNLLAIVLSTNKLVDLKFILLGIKDGLFIRGGKINISY